MTYTVHHLLDSYSGKTRLSSEDDLTTVHFAHSGKLHVTHPGRLAVEVVAQYRLSVRLDASSPRWTTQLTNLPCHVEIRMPDGSPFAGDQVTMADIARFRDLRGATVGDWTYQISGEKSGLTNDGVEMRIAAANAWVSATLIETVASKSAPPLVNEAMSPTAARSFPFDLWQLGTFRATTRGNILGAPAGHRRLRLRDPDGNVVAEDADGSLEVPITLQLLDRSRDAEAHPRLWTLDVLPSSGPPIGRTRIRASVLAKARIGTTPFLERITDIIGERGSNLRIWGETDDERAYGRIEILDEVSAALLDRYDVLKKLLSGVAQPDGEPFQGVEAGKTYNLANRSRNLGGGLTLHLFGMKIGAIDIAIGESEHLQPATPALKVTIGVEGSCKVEYEGFGLATAEVRDNRLEVEVGLELHPDGTFSLKSWMRDSPLDIDTATDAIVAAIAAGLLLGPLPIISVIGVVEYIESELNGLITGGLQALLDSIGARVPHIFSMLLGDDFTYRSCRFAGTNLVFDYDAPLEPNPKPKSGQEFRAAIGRSVEILGPNIVRFRPPTLGDTWAADNLAKVDHIVMVMMENRSFDHVLGYLGQTAGGADTNGWTPSLLEKLNISANWPEPIKQVLDEIFPPSGGQSTIPPYVRDKLVRELRESAVHPNAANLKTRFPAHVGHSLADVTEQLEAPFALPGGPSINNPASFMRNFVDRISSAIADQVQVNDVLGYYTSADLAFYKHLTDNYSWAERYYCSHPGPTLPNRMLSLCGNVQYDRSGEAILDNNHGDNFAMSRAHTIFDLLTRKGVSWRVYESYPSVTMLRFFARYATDTTNIVRIDQLEQDIQSGNLPAVTVIDPAMHSDPQNDDHPVADMHRGQQFLQDIYTKLRSNEDLWRKTLLLITYDEHGGFYDHAIPPTAEIRMRPMVLSDGGPNGPGPMFPGPQSIPYGVRVPTFVVSPLVPAGKGPDIVLDHCSILKTILARFCGTNRPFLSDRVSASHTFNAFMTEQVPRLDIPLPPTLVSLPPEDVQHRGRAIATNPIFNRQMRAGNVDSHDLMGMVARMLGRESSHPVA